MHILLFEDDQRNRFLPLAFTRSIGDLRFGILTQAERWQAATGHSVYHLTQDHLQPLYPDAPDGQGYLINARLLPTAPVLEALRNLAEGEALMQGATLLAGRFRDHAHLHDHSGPQRFLEEEAFVLGSTVDLFARNGEAIALDWALVTAGRRSMALPDPARIIGPADQLFLEEGAQVEGAVFNTKAGPIYIGRDAEVMEGSLIRGPFALGEHAQVKMGAKIYGPTTVGPHCRVGGEVSNSVLTGYSNKGHDGFLGNSVLGEWCNLGADTNTSNLKNNYGTVRVYDHVEKDYRDTGLTFVGLAMGDHSKCSINTMFNTGTVVDVGVNVYGSGFPPKYLPSFTWGSADAQQEYRLEAFFATAERVMARRSVALTPAYRQMLTEVFRSTAADRQRAPHRQD